MVTSDQIIKLVFSPSDIATAKRNAGKASLGGVSRVREGADRQYALAIDQLVGQLGQIAGHRWLYGHPFDYARGRWYINRHPHVGDGGSDVACGNIDFKASLLRYPDKPLLDYHLLVRPAERHQNLVYIPIIVDLQEDNTQGCAYVMGWATDSMLPESPEKEGVFQGAFALCCADIHPLPPFKWNWT